MVAQPRAFRTARCSAAPDLQPFNFANAAPSEVCGVAGLGGRGAVRGDPRRGSSRLVAASAILQLHRQGDSLARQIDVHHPDLDDVAGFDDVAGILDEAIGELRDVHEAVLVHADVDERAEVGDVRDDALRAACRA